MQGRPRRRRKRGEPSAHRYARTALSTAASRPARMALGAAAEERFISVLFNSPAALSFMHVTTLVTLYRQTVGLDASSERETTSPKPAQEIA